MNMSRRQFTALAAMLGGSQMLGISQSLGAEDAANFPSKPMQVLMPYPAGGAPDLLIRAVKTDLERDWKQPVIVENKPGGNGSIASEAVARSAPDGYTVIMGSLATHAINAAAYENLRYDPVKDFTPILQMGRTPLIITGQNNLPVNLKELIAFAKSSKEPITYASVGMGSLGHLTAEMFQQAAGVKMRHVPYKGVAQITNDLLGGHVQMAFSNVLNVLPMVKEGKLRGYAVTSKERLGILPDVPPAADTLPGFESVLWWGLFGPAKTPAPIVDKINKKVFTVLSEPANRAKWAEQGVALTGNTPDEFAAILRADIEKWGKIVRDAGVKL